MDYIKRIKDHQYAQCYTIHSQDNSIRLVSYKTIILTCRYLFGGSYIIECTGLYSMTTRKHISYFLKEYFPEVTYQEIKQIAGKDKSITTNRRY